MTQPIRIAVTGAGGQIGYALIFRIASGGLFGPDQPVALRLLEITPVLPSLNGTLMELEDCAFPLLADVVATDKAETAFEGADWVVLVGGLPRKEGMSRADLIRANGPIFTGQGRAINDAAGPNVRIATIANPCNTNCLIAKSHAPKVPADRWFAMTRLDQNRAGATGEEGGGARQPGLLHDDLGQPQRHAIPRLQERPDQRQAGDVGDHRPRLVHRDVHPDGGQAGRRGDQGAGRLRRPPRPPTPRSTASARSTSRPRATTGSARGSSPTAATASPPACSTAIP